MLPGRPLPEDRARPVDLEDHIPQHFLRVVGVALTAGDPGGDLGGYAAPGEQQGVAVFQAVLVVVQPVVVKGPDQVAFPVELEHAGALPVQPANALHLGH